MDQALRRRDHGASAQSRTQPDQDRPVLAYAHDERPWGGADPPGVTYLYAPDRNAEQPIRHLEGFSGMLQVDGYAGYKTLTGKNAVSLAFCWSHIRRKIYDLAQVGPALMAPEALLRIAALYSIESDIRGHYAEEGRDVRQARRRPIVEALSNLAEVIRYALSMGTPQPLPRRRPHRD